MATASLVVRIAADLNDFSRKMDKMTRDVDKAAKRIESVGRAMTIGITAPAALVAVAVAKMGAENENMARRMERVYGTAAPAMNAALEKLMETVPETQTDLQKMAIAMDNMVQGMGVAPSAAAKLSGGLLKLAGDMAAFSGNSMTDAMSALERGLAGKTKGLLEYGIVIKEADVKQEAYRQGLLRSGRELTPLGTMLASYSLILKNSSRIQGEAGRTAGDAVVTFKMLHQQLGELGDQLGAVVLPAFLGVARALTDLVKWMRELSPWVLKTAVAIVAVAAAIGPTLIIMAKLVKAYTALKAAMTIASAGEGIVAFLAGLLSPVGLAIAAIVTLGAALYGVYWLWKKFHAEASAAKPAKGVADMLGLPSVADLKKMLGGGQGGATDVDTRSPAQQMAGSAQQVETLFTRALTVGDRMDEIYGKLVNVQKAAADAMVSSIGGDVDLLIAATEAYDKLRRIVANYTLGQALGNGTLTPKQLKAESRTRMSDDAINSSVVDSHVQAIESLRMREAALKLPPAFEAAAMATLELAERFKSAKETFNVSKAKLTTGYGSADGFQSSVMTGLMEGLSGVMDSLGPAGLAFQAIGKIMQGLQPVLDAVMQPLVSLGEIIGIELLPILRPLFQQLKVFGIVTSICAEIVYRAAAGIARVVGGVISGIGRLIAKIPFLGGLGSGIQRVGDSLLTLSASFTNTANDLKDARRRLIDSTLDQAAAADRATEALLNVPTGYKVALARFRATDPVAGNGRSPAVASSGGAAANRSGGAGSGNQTINLVVDGKVLATVTVNALRSIASTQKGLDANWWEAEPA